MTTELQNLMLKNIARSEYSSVNGAEPESLSDIDWIWADTIIEDAEDKGVFTSLVNAGLAVHSGGKKDAAVTLTTAGFAAYKSLN